MKCYRRVKDRIKDNRKKKLIIKREESKDILKTTRRENGIEESLEGTNEMQRKVEDLNKYKC